MINTNNLIIANRLQIKSETEIKKKKNHVINIGQVGLHILQIIFHF